ncbi:MAG: biotin--[acetyl-CoA-carboxylase] ligase [Planctomycetes bacterium]|nr:biotin--[acetyl-CoA-carboxylase] ligase [Planctomycetota bacterium]
MRLTADSIRARLHTRIVGRKIVCLEVCESTNDRAWQEALAGAPDGTTVFAEEQTKGRGRFGRTWFAPRGTAVLCSVVLRPQIQVERVPLITASAALAAAEAVEDIAGVEARIRFPNDVLVGGRKIAGILVESRFISSQPDLFIVGIGVNVAFGRADLPEDLREAATSLAIERGAEVSRVRVARALLEALDRWYREIDGGLRAIRKAWRERSAILGRKVRVRESGRTTVGVVDEVDPIEGLVLRLESGHVRAVRGEHVERLEMLENE